MRVTLLGPQRRPTLDTVVAELDRAESGVAAPVATITAGWQERESDDAELSRLLGGRDVNLRLYQRWQGVQDRDPGFADGERRLAEVLAELQEAYLLRLDHALQAVQALQHRQRQSRPLNHAPRPDGDSQHGPGQDGQSQHGQSQHGQSQHGAGSELVLPAILAEAIAAVAELDAAHLRRTDEVRGDFWAELQPHDRPVIAGHRAEVAAVLAGATAVAVAGGHVGVLADVLHLFNVAAALRSPVIAWSAGAMALTERIVLFHDRSPHGPGHPEVYGTGLSLLRGLVALPHARARLLLDDVPRMAVLARRLAPAVCVPLEEGTQIVTDRDAGCPPGTVVLGPDGRLAPLAAA